MKLRYLLAAGLGALILSGCHQHTWIPADCITPKTCESCGQTEGEPLGHQWQAATCTEPKTCSRCGETEGNATGHSFSWTTLKPATCSEPGVEEGTCSVCGETERKELAKLPHTPSGEWVVTKEAVGAAEGTRVRYCAVCGEIAEEETYKLSPEEQAAYFKTTCKTFTYDEIARHPDEHMFEAAKFTGEVIQVMEDGDDISMRLNITKGRYTWTDTIYVQYSRSNSSESRILEDDIITVYGVMLGTVTYQSVLGASVTIPAMLCSYIEF